MVNSIEQARSAVMALFAGHAAPKRIAKLVTRPEIDETKLDYHGKFDVVLGGVGDAAAYTRRVLATLKIGFSNLTAIQVNLSDGFQVQSYIVEATVDWPSWAYAVNHGFYIEALLPRGVTFQPHFVNMPPSTLISPQAEEMD